MNRLHWGKPFFFLNKVENVKRKNKSLSIPLQQQCWNFRTIYCTHKQLVLHIHWFHRGWFSQLWIFYHDISTCGHKVLAGFRYEATYIRDLSFLRFSYPALFFITFSLLLKPTNAILLHIYWTDVIFILSWTARWKILWFFFLWI